MKIPLTQIRTEEFIWEYNNKIFKFTLLNFGFQKYFFKQNVGEASGATNAMKCQSVTYVHAHMQTYSLK